MKIEIVYSLYVRHFETRTFTGGVQNWNQESSLCVADIRGDGRPQNGVSDKGSGL